MPDVFCEEKCGSGSASVASVFLWLPSNVPCGKERTEHDDPNDLNSLVSNCYLSPPAGQSALAIGTVLVKSAPDQEPNKMESRNGGIRTNGSSNLTFHNPAV